MVHYKIYHMYFNDLRHLNVEKWQEKQIYLVNGLVQDCSISIAITLKILQSSIKPSMFPKINSAHEY